MTYHPTSAPRLSGSILYTLISLASLTLITACGGGGLSLDLNLSTPESRLLARCAANPFTQECNTPTPNNTERNAKTIADARDGFIADCVEDATSELCDIATTFVCEGNAGDTEDTGNPFAPLCQTDANSDTYELARASTISTCEDPNGRDLTSRFCLNAIEVTCADDVERVANPDLCAGFATDQAVVDICDANIFNSACDGNPTYIAQRNAFCATSADPRCDDVVSNACTANPFDTICLTGSTYVTPRATAIADCISAPQGTLCDDAIAHACTDNPFHALCYDASATVFQTARQTAVTNCGDGTTTITEQICTDAVQQTCEGASADVFNALCIAYIGQSAQTTACGDNDDDTRCYLAEQIDACAEGTETARCAQVSTNADIMACIVDPFATACVADSGFDSYLAGAQGTRYTYCSETGRSATDELCTSYRACKTAFDGSTTVPTGCGNNFSTVLRDGCVVSDANFLFSTQCDGGQFEMQRNTFCGTNEGGVNNLFHASCTAEYQDEVARDTFCRADPFHDGCKSNTAYADLREGLCTGDTVVTPHAACVTPSLSTVQTEPALIPRSTRRNPPPQNTARYADSFLYVRIKTDGARAPLFEPIVRTVVTPAVVNDQGVETSGETTTIETPTIGELSINVGRRGGEGASDALNTNPDGYVFFTLVKQGTGDVAPRTSRHAAILPTTNLGAPLTEAPATAVWPGHFSTTETSRQTPVDFYIDWNLKEIGFSNSAKTAIGFHAADDRAETRPSIIVANQIRLSIKFNDAGQLYNSFAEIRDATATPGRLAVIGFIGQEGVVAAFVDRENGGGAGGFTASNPDHDSYVPAFVEADVNDAETDADDNPSLVNYEDWLDSGARPSTAPSAPSISEFLQTTTFTDKTRGFASFTGANAQIGDFNSATNFRSILLRGDAKNGFALHTTAGNHYSGVLHTADLGAPITQTAGSAIWRGYLSSRDSVISQNDQGANVITTAVTHKLFDLTVKFSTSHDGQAGELSGNVSRLTNVASSGLLYTIEGRFNARGAISGTIARTEGLIEADLSGIIGQKGAIAVFVSNVADNKFAGGFVAVPNPAQNVTHDDVWVLTHKGGRLKVGGVYGLFDAPARQNHWLSGGVEGSAGGVNGQSRAKITPNSLNNEANAAIIRLSDATWRTGALGGSAGNGVAFYSGVFRECTTTNGQNTCVGSRHYYSGLFSQTDLGRPLTRTSGQAAWVGQLTAVQGNAGGQTIAGIAGGDIVLYVNFNQTGGTITGDLNANRYLSRGYSYHVRGNFNEDGFLRGNVNITRVNVGGEVGFLSGLIGQQGVVGAFVGPTFAGGFVGIPGRPRFGNVDYTDWLNFIRYREGGVSVPHNEAGRFNEILVTEANAPYNISYGNTRSDDGRARFSYRVEDVWSDRVPPGLTGGYSMLHSVWNHSRHPAETESASPLQRTYHAGIHPDTDVGRLPAHKNLGQSGVVATWKGRMNIVGNKTFDYVKTTGNGAPIDFITNEEFQIQVNFNSNRIDSPNHRADRNLIGGYMWALEATWDERGILTGTINNSHADFPNATITGLIGERGAVATIISVPNRHYGYSGGFIARP